MKKIKRESLKKAEKGSGVYTMGSVYKLPDTWTPTFDLSNHEKYRHEMIMRRSR